MRVAPTIVINHGRAQDYAALIRARYPNCAVICPGSPDELAKVIGSADIILAQSLPPELLVKPDRLSWIQLTMAGVDVLKPVAKDLSRVTVTNARGVHADVMSDYALMAALALAWDLPAMLAAQRAREWSPRPVRSVKGMCMGIVGLGAVGSELAQRASGIGMRVIGSRSKKEAIPFVERIIHPDNLIELLGSSDFVVLAVPSTPTTVKMIGERQLRSMRSTASLINIARGDIVDESALIRALEEHWIAGAALDVFEREPLPPENPLWKMPNVIVSPHMSGWPDDYVDRVGALFLRNLDRWFAEATLENVVDLTRGY